MFFLIISAPLLALRIASIQKFLDNASFDAYNPKTNEILFMRKDVSGIIQLFLVSAASRNPELEKKCLSCNVGRVIGMKPAFLPLVHKGASDWHPSGEWFITEMEIPQNVSWRYQKATPDVRLLAEPGAGWWNNLFLVKRDGSLWIKLTDFSAFDLDSGVLYPKFARDGKTIAWAERIGGAKPYDQHPFAQWVLKTASLDFQSQIPKLANIKTHPAQDGAIFEPQAWSSKNELLFAADIGYSGLPYPGYRIDVWEAEFDNEGNLKNSRNLTRTNNSYEEQSSYSPDEKFIAFMANLFDKDYEKRMKEAWKKYGQRPNDFITLNLTTDLYLIDRSGKVLSRLTEFAEENRNGHHPLVTRNAWTRDGKALLISLTLRSSTTGKKEGDAIYKIQLED